MTGPAWNRCAVLSVVLGVLWIFGIGSVAAVGLGHVGRRQIRRRGERGDLLTRIGIGLGWIGVAGALLIGVVIRAVI